MRVLFSARLRRWALPAGALPLARLPARHLALAAERRDPPACRARASQFLAAVSGAQLAAGLGGMMLAIRRHRAFGLPFWQGQESAVGRDSLLIGTALSAPAVMLGVQACATVALVRGPNLAAERMLGGLGATMVAGYMAERLVRRRLLPSGWDAAETPVVITGMSLAAVMAMLGLRSAGTQAKDS